MRYAGLFLWRIEDLLRNRPRVEGKIPNVFLCDILPR
jgi:hypothetical protein